MTWEEMGQRIAEMTPEQRLCPAGVAMQETGEVAHVKDIIPAKDFNGSELPDQFVVWYDNYEAFP